MRKKTIACIVLTAVCLFSAVQATLAAWRVSDPSIHAISIASLSGRIVEQYTEANDVKPGQDVEKIVNVKNTGSADCVVRVRVEKAWGRERNADGVLVVDDSYPTDNILIDYNSEYWYFNAEDGYFYYKGVLLPGETTAQPLFESFRVDPSSGSRYDAMTADITVKLECIQAAAHAITAWGMTLERLGITYDSSQQTAQETAVTFAGTDTGFTFDPEDTDLFANFKDLLPGETRGQRINVTNSASQAVEIFLRAEVTDQTAATPETLQLIERLLKEYVTAVVTTENGTVIYDGPIWGSPDVTAANPESMHNDISLGSYAAAQKRQLYVQLQVSPEVDNQYQSLLGYIRWVWSAQGEDGGGTDTPVDPPKTGDSNAMYIYFGIMLVSAILLVPLIRKRREEKAKSGDSIHTQN